MCAVGEDISYERRINAYFSDVFLSNITCQTWAKNNFESDGAWYNPDLPNGAIGLDEVAAFCDENRNSSPESVYLPIVLPRLTHSGQYSYASVDYIFASNQPGLPASNWGNVFFALSNQTGPVLIHFAVETWDRKVWPNHMK